MSLSLEQLASLTDSTLVGDGSILIHNVAALQDADNGDISFLNNPKYRKYLADSKASAIILSPDLAEAYQGNVLINKDPYMTFARVLKALFAVEKPEANIHASAVVAEDATMGEGVNIGANSVIEAGVNLGNNVVIGAGCVIGENCVLADDVVLHANVTLYSDTKIGARSAIHSGTVLGADGFGYAPQQDKSWYKILQIGNVVIGDDVEIGANTTIDRAALGSTRIGNGTKLDNQIQIAHNVCVGENTVIAGCAAIAGSTTIGDRCQIGGTVAMGGHLTIADDVIITGNSMVMKSIKKSGVYSSGVATEENRKWRRNAARFRQLDELAKIIKRLERDHDNR